MLRFAANVSTLFPEAPFLDRFALVDAAPHGLGREQGLPNPRVSQGPAPRMSMGSNMFERSAKLDLSGRTRIGKASFYGGNFAGREMADGTRMNPQNDSAASKTLPLGTVAKVTNLKSGESAVVTIRDRGPYVPGRIVDLSPATARKVGIDRHEGVSTVEVTPIAVPRAAAGARTRNASPDTDAARPRPGSTSAPR